MVAPLSLIFVIFMVTACRWSLSDHNQGSTIITESITAHKYPYRSHLPYGADYYSEYKVYQKKVPKFIPIPGYVWEDERDEEVKKLRW